MEFFFENENICDVFMNEIRMENEPFVRTWRDYKCLNKRKQKFKK
jgi:hypothetical protein